MVKKRFSGQTIAIIILTALLLLTIGFGGVYAYHSARSKKITGKIVMANLKISMEAGGSDKSEVVISNGTNIVPGQPLENSALTIQNLSEIDVYLIVVYEIYAEKEDETKVYDDFDGSVIDIDVEYINSKNSDYSSNAGVQNTNWIDYVFYGEEENKYYRCLVSTKSYGKTTDDPITVIGENAMSLSGCMGNTYQGTNITLTFQAYAIGSATNLGLTPSSTKAERCEAIVGAIYFSQGDSFLTV